MAPIHHHLELSGVKEQSIVIKLSGLMFIVGFILAGMDYRFNWFNLPEIVTYISIGVFLIAYLLWAEVLRENTYLSRTIKVEKNQIFGLILREVCHTIERVSARRAEKC